MIYRGSIEPKFRVIAVPLCVNRGPKRILVLRPKTRGIAEGVVCSILMFMCSFAPLITSKHADNQTASPMILMVCARASHMHSRTSVPWVALRVHHSTSFLAIKSCIWKVVLQVLWGS